MSAMVTAFIQAARVPPSCERIWIDIVISERAKRCVRITEEKIF